MSLTEDQIETIVDRYTSGESAYRIANSLGVTPNAVYYRLKQEGIGRRPQGFPRFPINGSRFDSLLEESLYWSGFIAADGHIDTRPNRTPSISIGLSGIDKPHLEKFLEFVEAPRNKISVFNKMTSTGLREYCSVSVTSKEIVDRLEYLGVKGPSLSKDLRDSRDFWRGVFDGDGYISKEMKYPLATLGGKLYLVEPYKEFIAKHLNINIKVDSYDPTAHKIQSSGNSTYKIVDYLYTDSSIYLDRKKKRADDIIEYYISRDRGNHV